MSNPLSDFKRTKFACYFSYFSMAAIFAFPPLLFVTFRQMYDISYTLLGTLVLINFCTQMGVDLIFTFFSKHFNIHKTACAMPLFTSLGMFIYALVPTFLPQFAYVGLLVGTVIFSVSAGLSEVLLSPIVAAIPSETPDRDMSLLHSLYGYGFLIVVILSTLFLRLIGTQYWMYLTLFWATLPILSFVFFAIAPFPDMTVAQDTASGSSKHKRTVIFLCAVCIFLGGASENSMTNWISSFMESALHIPKVIGDILGMASFAVLLALTRSAYAKYGKNISKVLLCGMAGAAVCYLVAGLSPVPVLSMLACVCVGICASMLWPGTLILMDENIPNPGVAAYALMAACGDFGSSVAPQLIGVVVDNVSASSWGISLGTALSQTPEQIGMKAGILLGSLFPILGVLLMLYFRRYLAKAKTQ